MNLDDLIYEFLDCKRFVGPKNFKSFWDWLWKVKGNWGFDYNVAMKRFNEISDQGGTAGDQSNSPKPPDIE